MSHYDVKPLLGSSYSLGHCPSCSGALEWPNYCSISRPYTIGILPSRVVLLRHSGARYTETASVQWASGSDRGCVM